MKKNFFQLIIALIFVLPNSVWAQIKTIQTIENIPSSIEAYNAYRTKVSTTPEGAASAFITAMLMYSNDEKLGLQAFTSILDKSKLTENSTNPIYAGLSPTPATYEEIKNYYGKHKDYLANSYILGTDPSNSYLLPKAPYQIELIKNNASSQADGSIRLFIKCMGADAPRPIVLKQNAKGLWKVITYNSLFVNVRLGDAPNRL